MVLCSFRRAGQPGPLTRLLSCTKEQLQSYRGLDLMPTHVVPSLTRDPNIAHNDHYSAYNKPGAVLYWLRVSARALLKRPGRRACAACKRASARCVRGRMWSLKRTTFW